MKRGSCFCLLLLLSGVCGQAGAQGFWMPAGDVRLRNDVALLQDEGVVRLLTSGWPIPADDVERATASIDPDMIYEPGLRAALLRVRAWLQHRAAAAGGEQDVMISAGKPTLLRGYDEALREEGELTLRTHASSEPWSVNIAVTAVTSPADGKRLRFDGSDVSLRAGNWILSANTLERWWGPGHDGSLILSNNARPMAGISIDRVRAVPFSVPIARWLGPWRFSAMLAVMEGERADVDRPLFMAMRASFQPATIVEFGLSRSAQFCGRQRPCDAKTFGRVLLGRDNVGIRVNPEDEPGNQMAGFDARLTSPLQRLPVAIYAQMIGEDGSSSGIPQRFLGLYGVDSWLLLSGGSALRGYFEYSNTTCSFYRDVPYENCAYTQGIFFAGYRYRGRSIGHSTDSDSQTRALGVAWTRATGDLWELKLRDATLDRSVPADPYNSVTFGPSKYRSASVEWHGERFGLALRARAGVEERRTEAVGADRAAVGFVSASKSF